MEEKEFNKIMEQYVASLSSNSKNDFSKLYSEKELNKIILENGKPIHDKLIAEYFENEDK